ncbi:MAG: metalloregulator ArsR/SmtB family transcription factor [Ectothiorhodospiraceae bacterium]|nr:metalloregulator ArsR/SmtB family transcription factor [Chromatiales bacterium]MCP5154548.1 metalloregulator ArsR/SmtB family transcription factor [Ectothiorhodospiraceae bacterium]
MFISASRRIEPDLGVVVERLLCALKAAADPSRLRLLALLQSSELTVSELTRILGQSQPRVSRHLKLLADAGLVERHQEGSWAFFRLADHGSGAAVATRVLELLPQGTHELRRDRERLEAVRREHAREAAGYFRRVAASWDRLRALHVPDEVVESAMLETLGEARVEQLVDLGTGTGRVLELLGGRIERGLGIDSSREMLALARANLERGALPHCQVRQGDIYGLNVPPECADLVTLHLVLHYLDEPALAIAEAARALRARGRLLVVDFAPHQLEFLRHEHAHRRLGFAEDEVITWCRNAGLGEVSVRHLRPQGEGAADQLTVSLWTATKHTAAATPHRLEVA